MMTDPFHSPRILALKLHSQSFGFAVFEGGDHLLDWGIVKPRGGAAASSRMTAAMARLLDDFQPEVIVADLPVNRGAKKTQAWIRRKVWSAANARSIPMRYVTAEDLAAALPGPHNKYEVAKAVVGKLDGGVTQPPKKRRNWQPEPYCMSWFDAIAIGLAYLDGVNQHHRH